MQIYTVRPGDSLYTIARRFGTTAAALAYANQLGDPSRLTPGLALVIPGGAAAPLPETEVNAYAYPNISDATLEETLPYLTWLCPFSTNADENGVLSPLDDARLREAAERSGVKVLLTVTNLGQVGFSSDTAHALFTRQQAQDTLLDGIDALLQSRGYYGVNLNFEYVYPYDRDSYNQFLRRLSERLHAQGRFLSTAIAPKTSDSQQGILYTGHDYAAHGRYADRVVIMTYEWGYTYSSPQAVSPVDRMRPVLDYAVEKMPAGKILMGMSNYGYDWRLPWRQGQAARIISNAAAANLAVSSGAEIRFDAAAQAPWFNYTDATGQAREVWFEDARSVRARLRLVAEYGLAGISWWTVNQLFRAGLETQQSLYSVQKL